MYVFSSKLDICFRRASSRLTIINYYTPIIIRHISIYSMHVALVQNLNRNSPLRLVSQKFVLNLLILSVMVKRRGRMHCRYFGQHTIHRK